VNALFSDSPQSAISGSAQSYSLNPLSKFLFFHLQQLSPTVLFSYQRQFLQGGQEER
jgi:hypothetical protein